MALCCLCLNATSQNVPDYVPTDGLVAWFNMDGEIVNEVNGSAGIGTGTIAAPDRNNMPGASLAFSNGAFGVLNNASIPAADITVTAWVYQNQSWSIGDGIEFICIGSQSSTTWGTIAGPEYIILNRGRGCSGGGENLTDYNFPLNEWVHLAYVSGGLGMPTDIYINGMYQGQSLNNSAGTCDASNLYFGVDIFSLPEHIEGGLDDIGIWNGALTEDEILALYNAVPPIQGCNDPAACNFDSEATSEDGSCVPSGCMEAEACNYNALAECEGEACDYNCCPGPGCCGVGMFWDYELEQCQIFETCQEDLDGDGVIGVNDLMQLLSLFGTDCEAEDVDPELGEFTCGEPMNYHGYDYATVQIGEQCWFAENLRTELYQNGESIAGGLDDSAWILTEDGAVSIYDEGGALESINLQAYGRLYNGYAIIDNRGICPNGWHVSEESEWIALEIELGMSWADANSQGWRGVIGPKMKSSAEDVPSWNGSNSSGFSGLAGGARWYSDASFSYSNTYGYFWASSPNDELWDRVLGVGEAILRSDGLDLSYGFSVRCIKDTE